MTLSEASIKAKSALKWLSIIFGALLVIWLTISTFNFIRNKYFPPPGPPPQMSFGEIPPPDFAFNADPEAEYSIDTLSGQLPAFPDQIKVYKILERKPGLLGLDKAKEHAAKIGFIDESTRISQNVYEWSTNSTSLTMNITDLNFNLTSEFLDKENRPALTKPVEEAKKSAENFVQDFGLIPVDLDEKLTKVSLAKIKNYSISLASSLSSAQVVQVSFFQKAKDGFPIFYPQILVSPMNFLVGEKEKEPQVVFANFFYQEIGNESSTYPIKNTKEAFKDLKEGKAYLASSLSQKKIAIKNVVLGYFLSDKKQNFLYPIYVFEGDSFVAYVPAISQELEQN